MFVYRSNRVEVLAGALCDVIARRPSDPFSRDTIVVHSRGMERWLRLVLADRHDIAANLVFPFPARVVHGALSAVLEDERSSAEAWQPESLAWSVLAVLPALLNEADFAPVRAYLGDDVKRAVGRRDWLLARRIADVFDAYLSYRPEWLRAWSDGATTTTYAGAPLVPSWQPHLFRAMCARIDVPHLGARASAFFARLASNVRRPVGLPDRVCFFGLSTLPPLFVDVVAALSAHVETHLFVLCPSQLYWGDIRSKRERARTLRDERRSDVEGEELDLREGNPLLTCFGRLGRDFQIVLEGAGRDYEEPRDDLFCDPAPHVEAGRTPMLAVLQSDILHLRHRGDSQLPGDLRELAPESHVIDPNDRSLVVHACHGRTRQVEVLRDELCALFAEDPTLEPRDVVVLAPDMEAFAPLVDAVFGDGDGPRTPPERSVGFPAIPYRIADRPLRHDNPIVEALLQTLALVQSRRTATELVGLLALEPVRARFGIDATDLPVLEGWIRDSRIRWGSDAAQRARHGLPPLPHNTWRFGLDRLLLGVAQFSDGVERFEGVLPWDDIEGGRTQLLGRLADLIESLLAFLSELDGARDASGWRDVLGAGVDALTLCAPRDAWRSQEIHDALDRLVTESSAVERPLTLDAVQAWLEGTFSVARHSSAFLSGAVTFCAMVPMRSVPFRVVAVIGIDDGAFPRSPSRLGFDAIAGAPRIGDRNPREDDRYLLLEALLAARERMVLLYTGFGVRDNRPIPPAVPVSELLDVCRASFRLAADPSPATLTRHIVHEHPLQPFSTRVFGEGPDGRPVAPTGFDHRMLSGARSLRAPRLDPPPFVPNALQVFDDSGAAQDLPVDDLSAFFEAPIPFLLRRGVGVSFERTARALDDREPLEPDGLERWTLGDTLLDLRLKGHSPAQIGAALRAAGRLPFGVPGDVVEADLCAKVDAIVQIAQPLREDPTRHIAVDLMLDSRSLVGRIGDLHAAGRVVVRFGETRARHVVGAWIRHVVLALSDDSGPTTHLLGRADRKGRRGHLRLRPVARDLARDILGELVTLFARGRSVPLLFFPEASWHWAESCRGLGADEISAIREEVRERIEKGFHTDTGSGEGDEAHVARVLGDALPWEARLPGADELGFDFESLATRVIGPLLDHVEDAAEGTTRPRR